MTRTVTKSDYESGERGYYTLINSREYLVEAIKEEVCWQYSLNKKIMRKMKLIIAEMERDNYFPLKFYVHMLKGCDVKVYGVGLPMKIGNNGGD